MNDHSGYKGAHLGPDIMRERCALLVNSAELIKPQLMRYRFKYERLSHVSLSSSYFDPDDIKTAAWEREEEEREEKHKAVN